MFSFALYQIRYKSTHCNHSKCRQTSSYSQENGKKRDWKNRSWHTKRMRCYALATMIWDCWFVGFMRLHFHFYRTEISLRLFLFGWIYVQISSFSYANTKYTTIRNKKHSASKLSSLLHFNANIFLDQIHRVHIYIIWWKEIHCVKCFD